MDAATYHADPCPEPSLSSHIANILLRQSPAHAWYAHPRLNPAYRAAEEDRFDYGTAAHAMLLEGGEGLEVIDAPDWRTKAAQEARKAARAVGKTPVLLHQHARIDDMVRVAKAYGAEFLGAGIPEHTVTWQEGAVWCRSRLDWLNGDVILDYKTTGNASPAYVCERVIAQMGYDVQAAFYLRSGAGKRFVFLFQETEAPYACSLIGLSPAMLAIAEKKVEKAIRIWRECITTGSWPSYDHRIHYAEPTPWQLAQAEAEGAEE